MAGLVNIGRIQLPKGRGIGGGGLGREAVGPRAALIDDLLRSAPAKVKERYAHLLRAAAPQPPTGHDGGGRKGRRGSGQATRVVVRNGPDGVCPLKSP